MICAYCARLFRKVLKPRRRQTWDQHIEHLDVHNIFTHGRSCVVCSRFLLFLSTYLREDASRYFDPTWNPAQDQSFLTKLGDMTSEGALQVTLQFDPDALIKFAPQSGLSSLGTIKSSGQVYCTVYDPNSTASHANGLGEFFFIIEKTTLGSRLTRLLIGDMDDQPAKLGIDLTRSELESIRNRLHRCTTEHDTCKSRRKASLDTSHIHTFNREAAQFWPTRLVNVGSDDAQLHIIETSPGHSYPYATLSHCWGNQIFKTLTSRNYDELCRRIPFMDLPKVFMECILLCRLLGIGYLWIDSLCVLQDDDHDRANQVRDMGLVYENCLLNIAAAASSNGSQGLFRPKSSAVRHAPLGNGKRVWAGAKGSDLWYSPLPLVHRGWVTQEIALSPRTVSFTDLAVFWGCRKAFLGPQDREWFFWRLVMKINVEAMATVSELDVAWRGIIQPFVSTRVTRAEDRTLAIAGIAERFEHRHKQLGNPTRYFAGCWAHNIHAWLIWYELPRNLLQSIDQHAERCPVVPTWSCLNLSPDTSVIFFHHLRCDFLYEMSLQDMDLTFRWHDVPKGPVSEGRLLLRAHWYECEVLLDDDDAKPDPAINLLHESRRSLYIPLYNNFDSDGRSIAGEAPALASMNWDKDCPLPRDSSTFYLLIGACADCHEKPDLQMIDTAFQFKAGCLICVSRKSRSGSEVPEVSRCGALQLYSNTPSLSDYIRGPDSFWLV